MTKSTILSALSQQLIVSCQPVIGGPLDSPEIVAALSQAALDGGAKALRIEGTANLKAVRARTDVPIIGLIKRDLTDSEVRISPWIADVRALAAAGADIIAFDATHRERPCSVEDLMAEIRQLGVIAMADCASLEDGVAAAKLGAEILGTTMSGYTSEPAPHEPDYDLVSAFAKLDRFVIAEGRYHQPAQARRAIESGADAVVVGSAITRPEHVTSWFAEAIKP